LLKSLPLHPWYGGGEIRKGRKTPEGVFIFVPSPVSPIGWGGRKGTKKRGRKKEKGEETTKYPSLVSLWSLHGKRRKKKGAKGSGRGNWPSLSYHPSQREEGKMGV